MSLNKQRRNACLVMDRLDRRSKQLGDAQNFYFSSAGSSIALRNRVGHDDLFQIGTCDLLVGRPRKNAVRENGKDLVSTCLVQCFGDLADGTAGVAHVVDDQTVLAADVTDN